MKTLDKINLYLDEKKSSRNCEFCGQPLKEYEWKIWKNKVCEKCTAHWSKMNRPKWAKEK